MIIDPLGDMLTRIRNAQMRRKSRVSTPGSKLRARVLDVLQTEGYIRGYSTTEFGNGRTEFDIELKYHEGQPVIRSISRVSKPGRRVYSSVETMPRVADGPRGDGIQRNLRKGSAGTNQERSNYTKVFLGHGVPVRRDADGAPFEDIKRGAAGGRFPVPGTYRIFPD